jgi:hypothetical protein
MSLAAREILSGSIIPAIIMLLPMAGRVAHPPAV